MNRGFQISPLLRFWHLRDKAVLCGYSKNNFYVAQTLAVSLGSARLVSKENL